MLEDLIYDVGMHNGDDTRHYLARGFRVVAIEANPLFVDEARKRFADDLERGRLTIICAAVGPDAGRATFWVNDDNTEHSSLVEEIGSRDGSRHHTIEVDVVRFEDVLSQFGVPHYLKLDIETSDIHCLQALTPHDLPRYVSVEAHTLRYLAILSCLGYDRFKVIDQQTFRSHLHAPPREPIAAELIGLARRTAGRVLRAGAAPEQPSPPRPVSSGPFGEETDGDWLSLEEAAYGWLRMLQQPATTWWDFHATKRA
jgi:FkbM family methyltransferase